jgi:uncharacterized membrane protein
LRDLFSRIRPQVFLSITVLGAIAGYALRIDSTEIAAVAAAGIIALSKDVITSDNN